MAKKIYIVTAGEYSDYHIEGVFEDEAMARAFCDQVDLSYSRDGAEVEIYDIMENIEPIDNYLVSYTAMFEKNGNELYGLITKVTDYGEEAEPNFSEMNQWYYQVKGRVKIRQGEKPEQIRERIKKIAIDKFYFEKSRMAS